MSSSLKKKLLQKISSTKRTTPPITRQRSRHNHDLATSRKEPGDSQESDFLYTASSQPSSNQSANLITLATPESQTNTMQREITPGSSRQANNQEEEIMETEELSSSACALNLSGILNKTVEGTSEMLKWLENEDHASPGLTEPNQINQTFLEEKSKRLKASLIILAKASHHRTFMETCLHAKSPPRNMCLWVEPHIYHATKETEKEWRDTLVTASLKLLGTLIKHYSKIIEEEKQKLELTLEETTTYLRKIRERPTRDTETQTWKNLKQSAESEAKAISEDLREQRNKKLTQRTQRKRKREQSAEDDAPQQKKVLCRHSEGSDE